MIERLYVKGLRPTDLITQILYAMPTIRGLNRRISLFLLCFVGLIAVTAIITASDGKAQPLPQSTVAPSPLSTPTPPIGGASETDIWDILDVLSGFVSALFEIAAITIGGIWTYMLFIKKRQKHPHAEIEHHITDILIADGKVLVHVSVTLSNTSSVLIQLVSSKVWVQKVRPLSYVLEDPLNKEASLVENGETEIKWPWIGSSYEEKWEKGECQIEPGESDESRYDFVVDQEIQTIRVYSYYKNETQRKHKIGWQLATIYDLESYQEPKEIPTWYQRVLNLIPWRRK